MDPGLLFLRRNATVLCDDPISSRNAADNETSDTSIAYLNTAAIAFTCYADSHR